MWQATGDTIFPCLSGFQCFNEMFSESWRWHSKRHHRSSRPEAYVTQIPKKFVFLLSPLPMLSHEIFNLSFYIRRQVFPLAQDWLSHSLLYLIFSFFFSFWFYLFCSSNSSSNKTCSTFEGLISLIKSHS